VFVEADLHTCSVTATNSCGVLIQVWFADADGQGQGSWWKAQILIDNRPEQVGLTLAAAPAARLQQWQLHLVHCFCAHNVMAFARHDVKSLDCVQGVGVLADPWSCGGLWERFEVQWDPGHAVGAPAAAVPMRGPHSALHTPLHLACPGFTIDLSN
jgi:hypothetical protein